MRCVQIVIAAFAIVSASSALAGGPYGSIHVGAWKGGAYTSKKTGAFSHCAAGASYRNGVYLVVSKDDAGIWSLGFSKSAFYLPIGGSFPVDLIFDGQNEVRVFAKAISHDLLGATFPQSKLNLFRKSYLMVARIKNATFQFSLKSTDKLISIVEQCVARTKAVGVANVGDFSLAVSNPPVARQPTHSTIPSADNKSVKTITHNGTGFVISKNGHVVTNFHVVKDCMGDITGNLTGEAATKLRVVSKDKINDLALLQAPKPFADVVKIRDKAVRSGDQVIAIGFPYHGLLSSDFTVTTGIVSSLSGLLNDTRYLQISAAVQPGNSGGPLLDTSGNLVGVVSAKINAIKFAKLTGDLPENINFAIKTGALRDFLDNSVVSYETAEPKLEIKTAEIAQRARAFTMLISCEAKVGK